MATLRDIKRKIASVNSTQAITRTMKMVSAAKLRKAGDDLEKIRAYALKMEELIGRAVHKASREAHPLLVEREETRRVLLVSLGSDRGLCGAFNMNVSVKAERFVIENRHQFQRIGVYAFGRKVRDYLQRRKRDVVGDWVDVPKIDQSVVDAIASDLMNFYIAGEFDKIYLIYNHFASPVRQEVVFEDFLPLLKVGAGAMESIDYLCEPTLDQIVEVLIPRYVSTKIYYALVESQTSEHAARMTAMENATASCGEMIRYLTLVYNKRRQESITNEMMDIVGGAEALRGA
jgi:F-type H+-transporting ATPase subunit gamma